MTDQRPDEELVTERAWEADKREFVADRREAVADEREQLADAREADAETRERELDRRELAVQERERATAAREAVLGVRVAPPSPPSAAAESAVARAESALHRAESRVLRDRAQRARALANHLRAEAPYDRRLAAMFAEIATDLYKAEHVHEVLRRVLESAAIVTEVDLASISLVDTDGRVRSEAHTDPDALHVDQVQYGSGDGPCLDALKVGVVDGVGPHWGGRWPVFAARANELGVGAVMAFGLVLDAPVPIRLGALNLYWRSTEAFDGDTRGVGIILAAHASIAIAVARERDRFQRHEETFQQALSSRDIIGQSKGILMERLGLTPEEAFDLLRTASQRLNIKLREVARRVVRGEDPA